MQVSVTPLVRIFAIAVVLTMATSTAWADHIVGNDAGTGTDAGNTKDVATVLPGYGSYTGYIASKDPSDWYRVDSGTASPRCVTSTFTPDNNATTQLTLETPTKAYAKSQVVPGGTKGMMAIATQGLDRTFFNTSAAPNGPGNGDPSRPGHYAFALESLTPSQVKATSSLTSDDDAGNSLGSAKPLTFGCTGGRIDPLTGLGDPQDVYGFTLYAGETLTYSFAYTDIAPLELRLLDSDGNVLDVIGAGEIDSYTLPTSMTMSTMYLSVVDLDAKTDTVTYLIGAYGPPTNGCRPQC